ncbi:LysR family transcriptional regulator [Sphingomonas naphthae]|uniref:LysR family transcriptional regulator n=1 Tax=Sphingomonas naphthae TaxID=1813468 RepID=A0ABY7TH23_9SPHN|nr:LysR family transcriptional regulator [Sphingomonas naphthae]WCT72012.1 LysR family transcriptional regulator [Sphingomonas naphthae]
MDLSIGRLHQLLLVARTGSFSRAAAELNISQPALSRSIAALEERYGFQIFNRMGHGVQLTTAGAQVIAQAEPLLQSLRVFDNNMRLFGSGAAGSLQIGLAPLLASQILGHFAGEFFAPDTIAQLRVMVRPGNDLLEALKKDAIELFLFPESHIDPGPEIDVEKFGHIQASCVVRSGHPLAARTDLKMEDLLPYPWASSIDPPVAKHKLSTARFVCDNYHILREATLRSDLVCICSLAFVAEQLEDGSLTAIAVADLPLPPTPIYLARLRGRIGSPLAETALKRIRQYLI